MDVENIVQSFQTPPPRSVRLKRDSEGSGIAYHPFFAWGELVGCGGALVVFFLLISFIPYFHDTGRVIAACITFLLIGLAFLSFGPDLMELPRHKYLAQRGDIVIGYVTEYSKVLFDAGEATITVLYEFPTQSGEMLSGKRVSTRWCYRDMEQGAPIAIVYLPGCPEKHEPYDSLRYCICESEKV